MSLGIVNGAEPDMILWPSVRLSLHATAAPTCSGFAAKRRAYTISGAAALVTARRSAAINASSVTVTADVGTGKLMSDLFLHTIISLLSF